jgi:hypothetical protein
VAAVSAVAVLGSPGWQLEHRQTPARCKLKPGKQLSCSFLTPPHNKIACVTTQACLTDEQFHHFFSLNIKLSFAIINRQSLQYSPKVQNSSLSLSSYPLFRTVTRHFNYRAVSKKALLLISSLPRIVNGWLEFIL